MNRSETLEFLSRPLSGKNQHAINSAIAADVAGKRTAFLCPDNQAAYYRNVFAGYPLVEVNPLQDAPPVPSAPSYICFEETAPLSAEAWSFLLELPARRARQRAAYRAALAPSFEDCIVEAMEE